MALHHRIKALLRHKRKGVWRMIENEETENCDCAQRSEQETGKLSHVVTSLSLSLIMVPRLLHRMST